MLETLIALCSVALLVAIAWLGPLVPFEWFVSAGVFCAALGMAIGVPTGVWYHVKLYAFLRPRGPLPERWWLRPVALHERLAPQERPLVMRWFYTGGAGFFLTVIGCALVILAFLLAALRHG